MKFTLYYNKCLLTGASLFTLFLFLLPPMPVQGQTTFDLTSLGNPISLNTIPRTAQPNSTVEIRVESFSLDLNRSTISWFVNNELEGRGKGQTSITLPTGDSGTRMVVEARVESDTGRDLSTSIIIQPASVDLIWEAPSYTPPFYKGKSLLGPSSSVKIVAIPNIQSTTGATITNNDLIFTWKQGSRVLGNQSGRGMDSITLSGYVFFKPLDVRVEIVSIDSGISATNRISIPSVSPFVMFYENHPTQGVRLEESFGETFPLRNEEVTLIAHPYFFDTNTRSKSVSYGWKVNKEQIDNPSDDQSLITLRPTGGSGRAVVEISLKHNTHVLQQTSNMLNIEFSNTATSVIF